MKAEVRAYEAQQSRLIGAALGGARASAEALDAAFPSVRVTPGDVAQAGAEFVKDHPQILAVPLAMGTAGLAIDTAQALGSDPQEAMSAGRLAAVWTGRFLGAGKELLDGWLSKKTAFFVGTVDVPQDVPDGRGGVTRQLVKQMRIAGQPERPFAVAEKGMEMFGNAVVGGEVNGALFDLQTGFVGVEPMDIAKDLTWIGLGGLGMIFTTQSLGRGYTWAKTGISGFFQSFQRG